MYVVDGFQSTFNNSNNTSNNNNNNPSGISAVFLACFPVSNFLDCIFPHSALRIAYLHTRCEFLVVQVVLMKTFHLLCRCACSCLWNTSLWSKVRDYFSFKHLPVWKAKSINYTSSCDSVVSWVQYHLKSM